MAIYYENVAREMIKRMRSGNKLFGHGEKKFASTVNE